MKCTCKICGKEYEYCHSCSITKDIFKDSGYCEKNCYDISMIIQEYRSNSLNPKDAIELLEACGTNNMKLVPGVNKYVDEIKEKVAPKAEAIVKPIEPFKEYKPSYINKHNKQKYKKESLQFDENASNLITDKDTKILDE